MLVQWDATCDVLSGCVRAVATTVSQVPSCGLLPCGLGLAGAISAGGRGVGVFSYPHLYVHDQIYSIVKSRTEVDRQLDNAVKKKVELSSQHFLVPDIPKGNPDIQAHRIRQR